MRLQSAFSEVSSLKRESSLAGEDIGFSSAGTRFLGGQIMAGGAPGSVISYPEQL